MQKIALVFIILVASTLVLGCVSAPSQITPASTTKIPTRLNAAQVFSVARPYLTRVGGTDRGMVMIFGMSTCPWCTRTKELLASSNVSYWFMDIDKTSTQNVTQVLSPNGVFGMCEWTASVPIIIIKDKCIIGYNEEGIKGALGL